jgi:hypothetical protein
LQDQKIAAFGSSCNGVPLILLTNKRSDIYYFNIYRRHHIVAPQANLWQNTYAASGQHHAVASIPNLPTFLKRLPIRNHRGLS